MTYEPILKVVRGEDGEIYVETELKFEDVIGKKTITPTLPLSEELGKSLIDYFEGMIESELDEEDKEPLRFAKKDIEEYLKRFKT